MWEDADKISQKEDRFAHLEIPQLFARANAKMRASTDLGAPPRRDGAKPASPPRSLPLVLGRKVCSSLESKAQVEHGTIKISAKQVNGLGQFGVGNAGQIPVDYALIVSNETFHALAKPHEFETARM